MFITTISHTINYCNIACVDMLRAECIDWRPERRHIDACTEALQTNINMHRKSLVRNHEPHAKALSIYICTYRCTLRNNHTVSHCIYTYKHMLCTYIPLRTDLHICTFSSAVAAGCMSTEERKRDLAAFALSTCSGDAGLHRARSIENLQPNTYSMCTLLNCTS